MSNRKFHWYGLIGKILSIIGHALTKHDRYHATPVGKGRHNAICMHNSKADASLVLKLCIYGAWQYQINSLFLGSDQLGSRIKINTAI